VRVKNLSSISVPPKQELIKRRPVNALGSDLGCHPRSLRPGCDANMRIFTVDQATESGVIKIDGKKEAFTNFLGLLDTYPFWFNIVTP
jgi:hypothetical protein